MIKKRWAVFSLGGAVSGFSNSGVEYDDRSFTIDRYNDGVFLSQKKCEEYIRGEMADYAKRGKVVRFIILPVFCFEDDTIF